MKSLKILHVVSRMNPTLGGVAQALRTMSIDLTEKGVHNEIVSLDHPDEPFLRDESILIHAIGPPKGPWQRGAQLVPWLVDNAGRFDVVILHGLWLYHGYALWKAMRISRRQATKGTLPNVFIMPHGMLDPYFQQASGRKLKAVRNWLYWKLLENKVIAEADGLLFTCEEERQLARRPFRPYRPKSETVVGLGVEEPPAYKPQMREAFLEKCPELRDTPYFLFLSRLHEKKGVDLLIKAYQKIRQNYVTTGAQFSLEGKGNVNSDVQEEEVPKLVIAGPGLETPYGQHLQQLVRDDQDAQSGIVFSDMLSGDAKWGAFYGCEAFVLPSHQENFGIAVVEALACGRPVLISNKVNIWREIETTGSGFVAADSVEGSQQLLEQWLDLPDEAKQIMGDKALEAFRTNFAVAPTICHLLNTVGGV